MNRDHPSPHRELLETNNNAQTLEKQGKSRRRREGAGDEKALGREKNRAASAEQALMNFMRVITSCVGCNYIAIKL